MRPEPALHFLLGFSARCEVSWQIFLSLDIEDDKWGELAVTLKLRTIWIIWPHCAIYCVAVLDHRLALQGG